MSREFTGLNACPVDDVPQGAAQDSAVFEGAQRDVMPPIVDRWNGPSENEDTIVEALQASLRSASALGLLARIEFILAEGSRGNAQPELGSLIEKWAAEIIEVDQSEIERLKRRLAHLNDPP